MTSEVDIIRSWRDRNRDRFSSLPDGYEDPVTISARGWWRDVNTLLEEIDRLSTPPQDRLNAPPTTEEEEWVQLDRVLQGIFSRT